MFAISGRKDEEIFVNVANNFQWHGAETTRWATEPCLSNSQNLQCHFTIYAHDNVQKKKKTFDDSSALMSILNVLLKVCKKYEKCGR